MKADRTAPLTGARLGGPDWTDVGWQDQARCAGTPTNLWFPSFNHPNRGTEQVAKTICGGCPVQAECLDWAFQLGDLHAILGGTTPKERANMRRRDRDKVWRRDSRAAAR